MRGIGLATNLVSDSVRRLPTLDRLAQSFVDSFSREQALYKKEDPDAHIMPWFMEVRTNITQKQGLVFLNTETFTYTGGAHPYMYNAYRAFDRLSGAPVALNNLLQDPQSLPSLTRLAEAIFRQQEGLTAQEGYQDYFFANKAFALPPNWRINGDSLEFIYNLYEIKPYAAGFTYIKLPLSAVDSLLVPAYHRPIL
jgi:hypothetical protein